jgi:hypothetical protein
VDHKPRPDAHTPAVAQVEDFWRDARLWPLGYERWVALRWPLLLLAPAAMLALALLKSVVQRRNLSVLGAGYVGSLGVALVVSAVFFQAWERTLRDALGNLYARGSVGTTSPAVYLRFSRTAASWFCSPYRYFPIGACVIFTFWVNWKVGLYALGHTEVLDVGVVMGVALSMWSYAVGAVAWCFGVSTRILWRLPKEVDLCVQFGHPDHCGGLQPLGNCSLKMTYPLLVGCVLLSLWGLSSLVPLWRAGTSTPLFTQWTVRFLPAVRGATVALIAVTTVLFVGSLWTIHRRMQAQRRDYERTYARLRDQHIRACLTLAQSQDDGLLKPATERLTLLEKLAPTSIGLSGWPLDRTMITTYAVAPALALLSSFKKELLTAIAGALKP